MTIREMKEVVETRQAKIRAMEEMTAQTEVETQHQSSKYRH